MRTGSRISFAVAALALGGAAQAATVQVDLSSIANYNNGSFLIGGPVGMATGNAGTSFSSLAFNLRDPAAGNNVWLGDSTGASADLKTSIYGATTVYTLINTLYGQAGTTAMTIEFKGSAGASQVFTLVGNTDVRDYNNWVWTNSINGTTTQTWWTNNLNPTPTDQTHRYDAQQFSLSSAFATQTLTDIVVTAGASGVNYSQPMLSAIDVVTAVPEPGSLALMGLGVGGLMLQVGRRSRRT
jgi:hypothetical protein